MTWPGLLFNNQKKLYFWKEMISAH